MFEENSSNSDQNVDFEGLIKKVDYDGDILDSEQQESQSQQVKKKVRRKNYSKRISSLLQVQGADNDKTKNIKKNCISAKQSRQRKKIYIQALEKTAQELKKQIIDRKAKIASNRDSIMSAIRLSNPQKSRFISQYLEDNRSLAQLITKMKPSADQQNGQKVQKNQKQQKQQIEQKSKALTHMINSYLYKFGFTGVLRRDVLQQLKMKWYQLAIDENIIMNGRHNQLKAILEKFKNCMDELEKKGMELQYLFRNLQYNLSQEDIVKFIINPEFLIATQNNRLDLSQMKSTEKISKKEEMDNSV